MPGAKRTPVTLRSSGDAFRPFVPPIARAPPEDRAARARGDVVRREVAIAFRMPLAREVGAFGCKTRRLGSSTAGAERAARALKPSLGHAGGPLVFLGAPPP